MKRPYQNQVTTPQECFIEAKKLMPDVQFYFIRKEGVDMTRELLAYRFQFGSTVPGTRSFHVFIPEEVGVVAFKRCAEDEFFAGRHNFNSAIADIRPKNRIL